MSRLEGECVESCEVVRSRRVCELMGVEVEVATRWRWKSRNRVTLTRRMACNERRALNLILRKVRYGVGTLRSILGIAVSETIPLTHSQC